MQSTQRRVLEKWHTVSHHTTMCNLIYAPCSDLMERTSAEYHYVQTCHTEFYPNLAINGKRSSVTVTGHIGTKLTLSR